MMRLVTLIFIKGIAPILLGSGLCTLGSGCASQQSKSSSVALIPSSCSLVVPSGELRMVQLMAGLPETGAEYGPFSGRNDARLGTRQAPFERIEDGYERIIFDRQFTSVGRPYNVYQDTTYAAKRISR